MIVSIGQPLQPDTKLWRYIRLSTLFLMMTKKHVFVPTVETLRKTDPLESSMFCGKTLECFKQLDSSSKKWLTKNRKKRTREALFSVWKREIRWRRCAWCWHAADLESMALWHLYAREGVAISTTPKRLFDCLASNERVKTAGVGRVHYCSRSEKLPGSEFTELRPYMIKQACYSFEQAVRVIFPTAKRHLGGLTLEIEPTQLLEGVAISPYVPESEAVALRQLLQSFWPSVKCEPSGALLRNSLPTILSALSADPDIGESGRRWLEDTRHRAGIAKLGIISRLPFVMKCI
ncbi:MAG TPA: hypothetical protein VEX43_18620 [Chthoniobacterales bacterium]|nr:hypothetical protein [Chthoniobacterales bacterium]